MFLYPTYYLSRIVSQPAADQDIAPITFYTNRENGRRVVVGKRYVALATSGGLRLWDRQNKTGRVWTMQDGLPSHNLTDIAFDSAMPDRLWILSGDWKWQSRLFLTTVTLSTGAVETVPPYAAPPYGFITGFPFWVDYRLRVEKDRVFIYAQGVVLTFDRASGQWSQLKVTDAPPLPAPRPDNRGMVDRRLRSIQALGAERWLLYFGGGLGLYDRKIGELRFATFPWQPVISWGGNYPSERHSDLRNVKIALDGRSVTFNVIEQKHYNANRNDIPVVRSWWVGYRVDVGSNPIAVHEISRQRLTTPAVIRLTSKAKAGNLPSLLHNGILTDFADDGDTFWFATYNEPGIHATGISRYDLTTRRWSYPIDEGGLAANQAELVRTEDGAIIAKTTNGFSRYDTVHDRWRTVSSRDLPIPLKNAAPLHYGYNEKNPTLPHLFYRSGTEWRAVDNDNALLPLATTGFLSDDNYFYTSGIGVMRLPRTIARLEAPR